MKDSFWLFSIWDDYKKWLGVSILLTIDGALGTLAVPALSQALIDKGRIVERGGHVELMAKSGFYYELYMSQFRGKLEGRVKE